MSQQGKDKLICVLFSVVALFLFQVKSSGQLVSAERRAVAGEDSFADLKKGFEHPPQSAGVRCFWWWLNSNVTTEAITRDLEQMKAKGFSGALIFDAGGAEQRGNNQVPAGPLFAGLQWRALFVHAVKEANRLGLELSLNILSGWNLGGPMVTPDMAAKTLTWSEMQIEGPTSQPTKLPVPKHISDYYRDIAVVAYPIRDKSLNRTRQPIRDLEKKAVFDEIGWDAPDCRFLLEDFPAVENEEDASVKDIINLTDKLSTDGTLRWQVPAGKWVVLRFGFTLGSARVSTSSGNWQGLVIDYMDSEIFKQYWDQVVVPILDDAGPLVGQTLKYLCTDSWECGGANWTRHFQQEFARRRGYDLTPYLPVIAGKIIDNRDISNRFLADFRKTVGDCIAENHYRYFAQLAHERGMGTAPESGGPHAGPFDALKCLGRSDIAMGEFWVPSPHRPRPFERFYVKQTSSAAHTYGLKFVGAEAFTSIGPHWNDVLWSAQKPSFDHEVCSGLNLCFIHTFTCSPKEMGLPGQEYFAGTHFNPNVTWWEYADAFLDYLHRCQFLLQQGKFTADCLYYQGDHVPNLIRLKEDDPAGVLPGYDYDAVSEEILLKQTTVSDGHIRLDSGMQYRLLALPDHKILSLAALKKIKELVSNGVIVLGHKPVKTVSLTGYLKCDKEFAELADLVWGLDNSAAGEHSFGKGKVIWGYTARQVLLQMGIKPDFEIQVNASRATPSTALGTSFDYIHYTSQNADMFFVCNQTDQMQNVTCTFRVAGRQPELWNPLNGDICEAKAFKQVDGRTEIPLHFAPYGSWFIIFHKPITTNQQGSAAANAPQLQLVYTIEGPWEVHFDLAWGGPQSVAFDTLISWTNHLDPGVKSYSGKATYKKVFDCNLQLNKKDSFLLDLGDIKDVGIAAVRLNGKDLGVVWTKPFQVDISGVLKTGQNELEITVVNSWRNRLLADQKLPVDKRLTRTNIQVKPDWKPLDSGLLGPVQILCCVKQKLALSEVEGTENRRQTTD
ncbi:MAG: hypothetical protein MUP16_09460 [Sedimentisphaerales bacterium]|nr:hypothetical protein [Sedimentisphaerales bacterium]